MEFSIFRLTVDFFILPTSQLLDYYFFYYSLYDEFIFKLRDRPNEDLLIYGSTELNQQL